MENRSDFLKGSLNDTEIPTEPYVLFNTWLDNAKQTVSEADAMVISTVFEGEVSNRIVYLRDMLEGNLVFYTNYESEKGRSFITNSNCSILFFWKELEQQIRIKGFVSKAPEELSDRYFNARPRESKLGAWASEQSKEIPNREYLESRVQQFDEKFNDTEVPRPDFWGGYQIEPYYFEFWQGRASRLHDRIVFVKQNDSWKIKRVAP